MARPKFESDERWNDERRKVKPHVRFHHSVKNHPKTAAVWADVELRGMLAELWRLGSERGAAHTGDWITLTVADLVTISGRERPYRAFEAVWFLCGAMGYEVSTEPSRGRHGVVTGSSRVCHGVVTGAPPPRYEGGIVSVLLRNFARKQGITTRATRNEQRTTDSSPPPVPTPHSPVEKKEASSLRSEAPANGAKPTGADTPAPAVEVDPELLEALSKTEHLRHLAHPRLARWWRTLLAKYEGIDELFLDEEIRGLDLWLATHPGRRSRSDEGWKSRVANWLRIAEEKARRRAAGLDAARRVRRP